MAARKQSPPTLPQLIGRTKSLLRHLERLLKRFPETDVDLGKQIWIRLFDSVWRYPADMCGPYPEKETEAIKLLKSYEEYKLELKYYFLDVVRDPSAFAHLPVTREVYIRSATEVLTVLKHQETHLRGILPPSPICSEPSSSEAPDGSKPTIAIAAIAAGVPVDLGGTATLNQDSAQEATPSIGDAQFRREIGDGVGDERRIALATARQAVVMPILVSAGWSRGKLVTKAGVSKNCVYDYLNGKRKLSAANRRALAEELCVKPEDLPD